MASLGGQGHLVSVLVRKGEIRCGHAGLEHATDNTCRAGPTRRVRWTGLSGSVDLDGVVPGSNRCDCTAVQRSCPLPVGRTLVIRRATEPLVDTAAGGAAPSLSTWGW